MTLVQGRDTERIEERNQSRKASSGSENFAYRWQLANILMEQAPGSVAALDT